MNSISKIIYIMLVIPIVFAIVLPIRILKDIFKMLKEPFLILWVLFTPLVTLKNEFDEFSFQNVIAELNSVIEQINSK